MKYTGRYSRYVDNFDLEHEINEYVEETKEKIKEISDNCKNAYQAKQIKKAIIETILDSL